MLCFWWAADTFGVKLSLLSGLRGGPVDRWRDGWTEERWMRQVDRQTSPLVWSTLYRVQGDEWVTTFGTHRATCDVRCAFIVSNPPSHTLWTLSPPSLAFALFGLAVLYLVLLTLHYFTYLALKKKKKKNKIFVLWRKEVTAASKAIKKKKKSSSISNVNK